MWLGAIVLELSIPTAGTQTGQRPIRVKEADITRLLWDRAALHGFPAQKHTPGTPGPPWSVESWTSAEQYLSWSVDVTQAGEYSIFLLYLCKPSSAGSEYEIAAGASWIRGTVRETGNAWQRPVWDRVEVPGHLKLSAGFATITLRVTRKPDSIPEIMQLRALELGRPAVIKAIAERAKKQRATTEWFVAAKYGVMFHWTARTQLRRGPQKRFCDAMRDFDVDAFARLVQETGAGYAVFTTSHEVFWFLGPSRTVERLMPGHTCERDLVGGIADALNRRGVRLIAYSGWNPADQQFAKAFHYGESDSEVPFGRKISDFLSEIGERYGEKVAGFFFDGGFETYLYASDFPFESVTAAARAGNPGRIISYNQWIFPKLTDFQDYWIGESGGELPSPPEPQVFKMGNQAAMQPHLNFFLDDEWVHQQPDTDIRPLLFRDEDLIRKVKLCMERKTVLSINMGIYQDGTVSPAALDQMRALRKAIRGR